MENRNDKQMVQLGPNDLFPFEYVSTRHDAKIAQGVRPEDLLVPGFWAHQAMKLKPLDEIRAHAEDGTWIATYVVLDCSRTWAKVQCLSMHRLTTGQVAETQASELEVKSFKDQHLVKHRGPHKWSVVRKADGAVIEQGFGLRDEAEAWLENHARQHVGAPPAAAKPQPVAA